MQRQNSLEDTELENREKEQPMNRFHSVTPILNVANVPNAIAYYVEKLGFEPESVRQTTDRHWTWTARK